MESVGCWGKALPGAIHVASLGTALVWLPLIARDGWFRRDEWSFVLVPLTPAYPELFEPFGEHWSTVPLLVFRGWKALFELDSFFPFLFLSVGTHILLVHLLWRWLLRLDVDAWLATFLAALLLFTGAGHENPLWPYQIGFLSSLVFGLVQLSLVRGSTFGWRDVAGWVAAIASLMSSGLGLVMTAVVTVYVYLDRGLRDAAVTAAVPAVVFLAWYIALGRDAVDNSPSLGVLLRLPVALGYGAYTAFAWTLGGHAIDRYTTLGRMLGVAGLLVFVAAVAWRFRDLRRRPVTLALLCGPILFAVLTGVSRIEEFGSSHSGASRYIYVWVLCLLPTAAVLLEPAARGRARPLVFGMLALLVVNSAFELNSKGRDVARETSAARPYLLAGLDLLESGERLLSSEFDPVHYPDMSVSELRRIGRENLGRRAGYSRPHRAFVATYAQLSVTTRRVLAPARPSACVTVGEEGATVQIDGPASYEVEGAADVKLEATVVPSTAVQRFDVASDRRAWLNVAAVPAVLKLRTTGADISLCA